MESCGDLLVVKIQLYEYIYLCPPGSEKLVSVLCAALLKHPLEIVQAVAVLSRTLVPSSFLVNNRQASCSSQAAPPPWAVATVSTTLWCLLSRWDRLPLASTMPLSLRFWVRVPCSRSLRCQMAYQSHQIQDFRRFCNTLDLLWSLRAPRSTVSSEVRLTVPTTRRQDTHQRYPAQNGLFFGGGLIGALSNGYLADKVGRIRNLQITASVCLIAAILQGASVHIAMLLVARFLIGLGSVNVSITAV